MSIQLKEINVTPEINALLETDCPVAIGISGGKDSQACALATIDYLNSRGHKGPRVLIHSDLGMVEWNDSLPVCKRLSSYLGLELIVVRRKSGDLMQRWESRWDSSVRRYINLETVTLVLPWSTPSMRFCTSELKTQIIESELRRRFKGKTVINVTGVRRDESKARSKGTIASFNSRGDILNWRPISDWNITDVFERISLSGLNPHQAYTNFGMSRVSCRFCIMSSWADMVAATSQEESHDLLRRIVSLEIKSTFAFQGSRWLADVAPHLLDEKMKEGIHQAKQKAAIRVSLEKHVPKDILFVKGWPTRVLTSQEATVLARVRSDVSEVMGFDSKYLDAQAVQA